MRDDRRTRLVLGLLLLVSFTLITLDLRGGSSLPSGIRSTTSAIFGPLQRGAESVTRPITDLFRRMTHDDSKTIENLKKKNDALQQQLNATADARHRAAELDSLLKEVGLVGYDVVPARVIAVGSAQGFDLTVEIDAGSNDGLHADMTVINGQGLVGRVKYVTATTATVVLLIDPDSGVGVRLQATGQIGVLSGQGQQPMQLVVQNSGHILKPGDQLVTLGSVDNTPYVPGIPVGEIKEVTSIVGSAAQVATVTPFVDVSSLDLVGVVVAGPRTTPRVPITAPSSTVSSSAPSASNSVG